MPITSCPTVSESNCLNFTARKRNSLAIRLPTHANFFPMGAYTAYLLEYDPKSRIGFGAVTMGYGWELGNMSLDEMEGVKVRGLGIERDLYILS